METLQQFGIALIQSLQSLGPSLEGVMELFSFLGRAEFYILLLPVIYWNLDRRLALRTILILFVADGASATFKLLFHQPRPYWIGDVRAWSQESTYGIPSSHASDSLGVWGNLAYRLKSRWFQILSVLLVLLIALSRLYLGMHFPHDIVFGWLIGLAVVAFFAYIDAPVVNWARRQNVVTLAGAALALSLVIILIGAAAQLALAGTSDPEAWRAYAGEARSPAYSYTLAGAIFGTLAGYALMRKYARFQTGGTPLKQVARYFVGVAGVLLIFFGLDIAFSLLAADESALGYFLRYTRYALVTVWATFVAPWIFLKLKLADAES